jgi:hypothetical protein
VAKKKKTKRPKRKRFTRIPPGPAKNQIVGALLDLSLEVQQMLKMLTPGERREAAAMLAGFAAGVLSKK